MKKLLFILIVCCGCGGDYEQHQNSNDIDSIQESMDKHGESFVRDSIVNSVSIGIYIDGKTYLGHYGELAEGKKPNDNTLYEIASVSKTFAGTLIAQAELDGKLNIEDNIQKYLNEDYINLQYDGNSIKIKHLITHTSGLPKFLPDSVNTLFEIIDDNLPFKYAEIEKSYNRQKFLVDLHSVVIDTVPGSVFKYSNIGVELIAHILENIYGEKYQELLQEYICSVVNMPNTKIHLTTQEKNSLVDSYFGKNHKKVPHLVYPLWGASGGIKSTMPDLINYMKFQLDKNNLAANNSHKVIYEEEDLKMGYLWFIDSDEKDGTYYVHDGTTLGLMHWFFIFPKYNFGISIISNHIDEDTEDKMISVVNGVLDDIRK